MVSQETKQAAEVPNSLGKQKQDKTKTIYLFDTEGTIFISFLVIIIII